MPLCAQPALATDLPPDRVQLAAELVPPVPPWPEGLPEATRNADGSAVVPKALGDATEERLELLLRYPELCRTAVEQMARVDHIDHIGQLAVTVASMQQVSNTQLAASEAHRFTFVKGAVVIGITAAITFGLTEYFEHHGKKN